MEKLTNNDPEFRVMDNPDPELTVTGVRLRSLAWRHYLLQSEYRRGLLDESDFVKRLRKLIERRDKEIFKAAEMVTDSIGGFGLCAAEDIINTVEQGLQIRQTQVEVFLKNTGLRDYFARLH